MITSCPVGMDSADSEKIVSRLSLKKLSHGLYDMKVKILDNSFGRLDQSFHTLCFDSGLSQNDVLCIDSEAAIPKNSEENRIRSVKSARNIANFTLLLILGTTK